jgi:pentatricopeptide repeat protein
MAATLLLLLCAVSGCAGALLGSVARPAVVVRHPSAFATASIALCGNYQVGSGQWPAKEPKRSAAVQQPKQMIQKRGRGRGRGRGRRHERGHSGRGTRGAKLLGSPVLHNALRRMDKLEVDAPLHSVHDVLHGKKLTARDYTTVLKSLKQRGAWPVALRVGEWLSQRAANSSADAPLTLPNRVHYQVILSACAVGGASVEAQQLVDKMQAEGMPLDVAALSSLVLAHERAGQPRPAVERLAELESLESTSPDQLTFSYAAAMRALEAAGEWKAALNLLERMEARGVTADTHCYSAALSACKRGGQVDRALELFARAREGGDERSRPNAIMYTMAMAACNAGAAWEESLLLLKEWRADKSVTVDKRAYSLAMAACASGRQWELALTLIEEMEAIDSCRGNVFAWNNAMVACTKGGEPGRALELFERMCDGACEISEHSVAAALVASRAAASANADADGWQRSQSIFDRSSCAGKSIMCYEALLGSLADGAQWSLLLSYFERLKLPPLRPSALAYERAIEACEHVDVARALILKAEMQASKLA